MGPKYYKNFIEHPLTYTIKGRKRNAANYRVNFSSNFNDSIHSDFNE